MTKKGQQFSLSYYLGAITLTERQMMNMEFVGRPVPFHNASLMTPTALFI